jgi:leucyl aminopeptidase
VFELLPPERRAELRARNVAAGERDAARCDAVVFVVAVDGLPRLLRELPHAALWRKLYASQPAPATVTGSPRELVLAARLPNSRHTLGLLGALRAGAAAYDRLKLGAAIAREALKPGVKRVRVHVLGFGTLETREVHEAIATALLAAAAPMPAWKVSPQPASELALVELATAEPPDLAAIGAAADGNHLARWLAMLPPNALDCASYRQTLEKLARRERWQYRFYDEPALEKLGAGAFLAVSRSNAHRDAGIVRLTYRGGRGAKQRIGLVGKGICFDTGGINLKPHRGMYQMHGDMQGSAVAVGTLLALSRLGVPVTVDCWLALTENEIGPRAYRPQEVVRAINGVTIQVVHSDAEGRMVLADTLALAAREAPALLLDFATLTGACVQALTERYSGAFTNRSNLHETLQRNGRDSGERVWCFPLDEDYDSDLESAVADTMQCALDNKGDHILAARFLSRFVPATVPWVHIDLSSSERKGGLAHIPTEFTGFGVRYATRLLADPTTLARLTG